MSINSATACSLMHIVLILLFYTHLLPILMTIDSESHIYLKLTQFTEIFTNFLLKYHKSSHSFLWIPVSILFSLGGCMLQVHARYMLFCYRLLFCRFCFSLKMNNISVEFITFILFFVFIFHVSTKKRKKKRFTLCRTFVMKFKRYTNINFL